MRLRRGKWYRGFLFRFLHRSLLFEVFYFRLFASRPTLVSDVMYKSYHVSLLYRYRYSKLSIPRTASNSNCIRVQGAPISRLEARQSRSPFPPF